MTPLPTRVALTAALATAGALAFAAPASATVTPVVNGNTLTVTGDAADGDAITIATAGGFLTVNGVATTLAANANAQIVVNAAGGRDIIDATALVAANYGAMTVNGGGGNDAITGGGGTDTLHGDAGDDRLVGFRSGDFVRGGEGDDVMVWNNGDATDVNDGDEGTDEVEVNGSPIAGDEITFRPGAEAGRVQLNRVNLIPFGIDLSAERLTINGLDGDDLIFSDFNAPTGMAGRTNLTLNGGGGIDFLLAGDGATTINGGSGGDELIGGDAPDLIRGGDGGDAMVGVGGDDRLIGDRGLDLHSGGPGDDVMVWNNGDGSDFHLGGDGFDRAEVNGSATGGDTLELVKDGSNAKIRRTNLVPFEIGLGGIQILGGAEDDPNGSVEAVSVNGGGGDDQLTVSPGLSSLLVVASGDAGDDELTGAEESDTFLGGSGNDTLTPGAGSDLADGEQDDDRLFTRDGEGDLARGGSGADSAQTDSTAVDATSGVETLDATPLPAVPPPADDADTKALLPTVGKARVVRSRGRLIARVPVSCPEAEAGGCRTTLTLETSRAVRFGKTRAVLVLGSKTVRLSGGQSSTVSIRLARGAAGLARRGRLATRLRITSSDAAGNTAARSVGLGLRIAR